MRPRPAIGITIRSFDLSGPAYQELAACCDPVFVNRTGKRLTEEELCRAIGNTAGVIAGTEPFTGKVIGCGKQLKVISRVGTGVDSIDRAAASRHGIRVCTTPDAPVQAVAEHTLALILAVLKRICSYSQGMRRGDQHVRPGTLLAGRVVGIAGLGRIGFRVASLLQPLGCRILYYDPYLAKDVPGTWERTTNLGDLLQRSEILTLHAGPAPDGLPMLGAEEFARCRKGIVIINTARGTLIDERAMVAALKNGTVAGAGLDVFPVEPYTGELLAIPDVVATPHVASNTRESRQLMEIEAARNLIAALGDMD